MTQRRRTAPAVLSLVASIVLAACSTDDGRQMKPPTAAQNESVAVPTTIGASVDSGSTMSVTGPWTSGSAIDSRYTCDGLQVSPPLTWTTGPEDTQAYAITIDNIDDPGSVQWAVTNIDFETTTSAEGSVPAGGYVALNAKGLQAYDPPCPPAGTTQTYVVTVFALDSLTPTDVTPTQAEMKADIEAVALEAATTVFTVTR